MQSLALHPYSVTGFPPLEREHGFCSGALAPNCIKAGKDLSDFLPVQLTLSPDQQKEIPQILFVEHLGAGPLPILRQSFYPWWP